MYIGDTSNLAVKESSPARTRGMSISFGGMVGAEEPVGLFDNECVCTHVPDSYVIVSLRNPWCTGVIGNILTWLSDNYIVRVAKIPNKLEDYG